MNETAKMKFDKPLLLHEDKVRAEWVDEYGHMNLAYYVAVCDWGTYKFWELVNEGRSLAHRGGMEYAIVETHVNYLQEVHLNDALIVETQLLGFDDKRFNLYHTLRHADQNFISAGNEVMGLGFNLNTRRIQPFVDHVQTRLTEIFAGQKNIPKPTHAGRAIALPKRQK